MPDKDKQKYPGSPNELDTGGLTGRISGVTRVGPKAIALGACLIGGLVLAILFAMNRPSGKSEVTALPTLAAVPTPKAGGDGSVALPGETAPPSPEPTPTPQPTDAPIPLPTAAPPTPTPAAQETTNAVVLPGGGGGHHGPPQLTQAQIEERRVWREELNQAIHSKIIAVGNDKPAGAGSDPTTCVDASGNVSGGKPQAQQQAVYPGAGGPGSNANSRDFLNGPLGQYSCAGQLGSAAKEDYLASKRAAAESPYEVLAGSIIPAALISGMNSELPGLISAQVRQDVYDSKTGKYLLIPRGSRLLGLYKSGVAYGQSRVLVAWSRLIFPDTSGIDLLNMSGVDVEGNAGLSGVVDNHYGKIFGAALLTSVLAVGLTLSQPQQQSQSQIPTPQQQAAGAVSQQIIGIGTQLSNRALNLSPTIQIPRGYPFNVMVDRDMTFPGPYQGL